MSVYKPVVDLRPARIWNGVLARIFHGERLTIGFVDLEPNVRVPEHRHENEQLGFVLVGSIRYQIGGEERACRVGDTYKIASDVPHSATAGAEGATVVDVFAPVRREWKEAAQIDPFPGRWPPSA